MNMIKEKRIIEMNYNDKLIKINLKIFHELKESDAFIKVEVLNQSEIYKIVPIHLINEWLTKYSREFIFNLTNINYSSFEYDGKFNTNEIYIKTLYKKQL